MLQRTHIFSHQYGCACAASLQETPFQSPTVSFSCCSRPRSGVSVFPLRGQPQVPKRAPAGRPGAGRGAAPHVRGLPGGSPQPPEPLIGFQAGACVCPRSSFRLLGAESRDSGTMAPVHGDDCELGPRGVPGWESGDHGMIVGGRGQGVGLLVFPWEARAQVAPRVCLGADLGRQRLGFIWHRTWLPCRAVCSWHPPPPRGFLFGRLLHLGHCGSSH